MPGDSGSSDGHVLEKSENVSFLAQRFFELSPKNDSFN